MHWFTKSWNIARRQGHRLLPCLGAYGADSARDELTSMEDLSSSSDIIQLPPLPMELDTTLWAVVAGNLVRNAIVGEYDPESDTVLVDASRLPIPFTHTVHLESCDFRVIGHMPVRSNGCVIISFTHVNIKVWKVVVHVPYKVIQSRLRLPELP
ncbi:uncharacterized protein BO80DRAFT_438658 [Aspergillus ibericus CBS 121593]|uniref:Uncharacterized protein n=1 Tax=Aspergillus ibericus CBS 121593 TaxID=1448316 RepID=A0A395GLR6_9EURO|nr:hypothetical protein BO80DRAFT_438658 [Aspergillus ibericus CBS 121593]RAK96292.1 hypothetical protein BO80DRAFT_438658 [Aspergillus ibericus CBS 121593]